MNSNTLNQSQTLGGIFSEEYAVFFDNNCVLSIITEEQLKESKSIITKNIYLFNQQLRAIKAKNKEEETKIII